MFKKNIWGYLFISGQNQPNEIQGAPKHLNCYSMSIKFQNIKFCMGNSSRRTRQFSNALFCFLPFFYFFVAGNPMVVLIPLLTEWFIFSALCRLNIEAESACILCCHRSPVNHFITWLSERRVWACNISVSSNFYSQNIWYNLLKLESCWEYLHLRIGIYFKLIFVY